MRCVTTVRVGRSVRFATEIRFNDFSFQEFLKTLDPPIVINRDDLKRWHPSFMVDFVPDVTPQEVPQAPNSEGPATAKQVLGIETFPLAQITFKPAIPNNLAILL